MKGIGLKTAQRIIVDLKDKIPQELGVQEFRSTGTQTSVPQINAAQKQVRDEAVGALTMLGFSPAPTQKVVNAILKEYPDAPVEQVVKMALKQIK